MSNFDDVLRGIDSSRKNTFNCIPFPFPSLAPYLPGIVPKHIYLVTAGTGVGKTQFTDFAFVYNAYDFVRGTETDITVKIFYYSLELSKNVKTLQGICKRLYEQYDIVTDINTLQSFSKNRMSEEVYQKIMGCHEYFDQFSDVCSIYDDRINPYGIYKELYSYARANGTIETTPLAITEYVGTSKVSKTIEKFKRYVPNKPKEIVIVVIDHLSLISTQADCPSKHEAMLKVSNDMVDIRNKFGYTIVMVQQQMASKEAEQFTNKGSSIISKLEPGVEGLSDMKLSSRDAEVIIGLFNPHKFGVTEYRGRNIEQYGEEFRSLSIIKNRYGVADIHMGMRFKGAVNHFNEI